MDIALAHRIVGQIPLLEGVERVENLDAGFSRDSKYVLWENTAPKYLLRVSNEEHVEKRRVDFEKRRTDFDNLVQHYDRGVLCSRPYEFGVVDDDQVR